MALQELKQRISRYFYSATTEDGSSKPTLDQLLISAEVGLPLRDLSNTQGIQSSSRQFTELFSGSKQYLSAPTSPAPPSCKENIVLVLAKSSDSGTDASADAKEPPVVETLTSISAQPVPRLKRRASFGPKAEPLSKKLWRKKERERLRELDEQIRTYTLLIAEKEALYRKASQLKRIEQCDDLTQQLSELLELRLACTREKADLRNQITRKSRNANNKFRTL